jgi:hypothetical protein
LLPFIGSDFYTKGEPREASVAVSMLESGNWILPRVYADEFAYKPPMAHWFMALCSLPAGHVTEFTSRLPSAIAQIVMIGFVLMFFGRRTKFQEAFIATLLLLTSFEIHRAGITARVDMVLTCFTVLGLMQLYRWENKLKLKGLPVIIPILLSGAILTKGPVGVVLPLFVFFIYLLTLRTYSFWRIVKALFYIGISSFFIPLIWYLAAYRQGGDEFLDVILAENFGRFFHLSEAAINYELGHREGIHYNFVTLLAGFIPWTLLFVFSLFGVQWRAPGRSVLRNAWAWFASQDKIKRFCIVVAVCVIFFYSIPSSKRSVYLMPAYPFICLLLAQYFIYITEHFSKVTRIFAWMMTGVCTLAWTGVFVLSAFGTEIMPSSLQTLINKNHLGTMPADVITWLVMALFLSSIVIVIYHTTRRINLKILYSTILLTVCLNFFIDGVIMRSFRAEASAKPFAEQIRKDYPLTKDNMFVMNNLRQYANLYALNFYLGNTFRNFETEQPSEGYLLTTEKDASAILNRYSDRYTFDLLTTSRRLGDIRGNAVVYKVLRKNSL